MRYFQIIMMLLLSAPITAQAQMRGGYIIMQSQVEVKVASALEKYGVGDSITAKITQPNQDPLFKHQGTVSLNVENVDYDARKNTWSAEAQMLSHGNVLRRIPVSGTYAMQVEAPVLIRSLKRGDVIRKNDLEMAPFQNKHITRNTAMNIDELIGLSARRNLTAARPISRDQVEAPRLIKRGDAIQMFYSTPHMEIKAMGEALEHGSKGQIIRARNTESGMTVRGVVESVNAIRISGGGL